MTQELINTILNSEKFLVYLEFIDKCRSELTGELVGEKHHIIPKCMNGTNNKDNLILLSYENHYNAHKLLSELFPDCREFNAAWWLLSHTHNKTEELTEEEFAELRDKYKKGCSEYFYEHPNKNALNKTWYNNGEKEIYLDKEDDIPIGFIKGRLKMSNSTKEKLSNNSSQSRWYNNGIKEIFSKERPEGYALGRIKVGSWYNNSIVEIQIKNTDDVPEGFVKGRLKWSEERRQSVTGINNHNYGKSMSQETRNKMSIAKLGVSTIEGRHWYNNGIIERPLNPDDKIPDGFKLGRLKNKKDKRNYKNE